MSKSGCRLIACKVRRPVSAFTKSRGATATIFAAELGFSVALLAVPQALVQALFFHVAYFLLPLVSPSMQADFSACDGIIMLATGLRICGIKIFPIVNMLLAVPCSALWSSLVRLGSATDIFGSGGQLLTVKRNRQA